MLEQSFQWQGRHDGEGAEHARFHHQVNQCRDPQYALIGFASDAGVKRNLGRVGAVAGPDAIRSQLANLPLHQPLEMIDLGTVHCVADQLEQAQAELAATVCEVLNDQMFPIVIGGGHEVAFGSFLGLHQHLNQQANPEGVARKIGIINFDAHFDLRQAEQASSGTPFLQAAQLLQQQGQSFHYLCLGVAQHANTRVLFERAQALGCQYVLDREFNPTNLCNILIKVKQFITDVDDVYVTIDLDVFSSALAPGVSAPAVRGIDYSSFEAIFQYIQRSSKLRILDLAECNPRFDIDHKTAKLAAYIIYNFACSALSAE